MITHKKPDYALVVKECEDTPLDPTAIARKVVQGEVFYTISFKRSMAVSSHLFAKKLNDLLDVVELIQCGHVKPNDSLVSSHGVYGCDNLGAKKNTNTKNYVY